MQSYYYSIVKAEGRVCIAEVQLPFFRYTVDMVFNVMGSIRIIEVEKIKI